MEQERGPARGTSGVGDAALDTHGASRTEGDAWAAQGPTPLPQPKGLQRPGTACSGVAHCGPSPETQGSGHRPAVTRVWVAFDIVSHCPSGRAGGPHPPPNLRNQTGNWDGPKEPPSLAWHDFHRQQVQ